MVKRQTVWLSTMMVLSLMLIGYYTMNNQSSAVSTPPAGGTVSTSATDTNGGSTTGNSTTPGTDKSSGSDESGSKDSKTTSATASTTTSDWYTSTQMSVNKQISQEIGRLQSEMANNNTPSDQISQAAQELGQLQQLDGGLSNATQLIKADGYSNAVIVPDSKQQNFMVYVDTTNLQKADVLKVMNIVSQQLDVSMLNIEVKAHS